MVKLNKIYTRTGDDGTTGLADGSRIGKNSPLLGAIGDVDEANSALGLALALGGVLGHDADKLRRVQNELFDLGADIATPPKRLASSGSKADFSGADGALRIIAPQIKRLEEDLDFYNAKLASLTSFILPGGSTASAQLHVARTVCRRAERSLTQAVAEGVPINPLAQAYLNRLSDYLFVLCRYYNRGGAADILWQPGSTR